jgi:hypothetical protein
MGEEMNYGNFIKVITNLGADAIVTELTWVLVSCSSKLD